MGGAQCDCHARHATLVIAHALADAHLAAMEQEDDGVYEVIDEIQQDETNYGDYEYPSSLDETSVVKQTISSQQPNGNDDLTLLNTFPPPPASAAPVSDDSANQDQLQDNDNESVGYAKAYELLDHSSREALIPESLSSVSDSSLSDSENVFKEIRQKFPSQSVPDDDDDDKLFIMGTLENDHPPLSFKSSIRRRSGAISEGTAALEEEELKEELLEEQGIYQGLVMTDDQRRRLGIMPESIYMTTNLENWLDNMTANQPHPSTLEERPVPPPVKPPRERRYSGRQNIVHPIDKTR